MTAVDDRATDAVHADDGFGLAVVSLGIAEVPLDRGDRGIGLGGDRGFIPREVVLDGRSGHLSFVFCSGVIAFAWASQYGIAVSRQGVSQRFFEGRAIVKTDANQPLLSNASIAPAVLPCRWFGMLDLSVEPPSSQSRPICVSRIPYWACHRVLRLGKS